MKIRINSTINPTCECCYKIGKVAISTDTHTEFYCAECYIKKFLPDVTLVMSNVDDDHELTVGTAYVIKKAETDLITEPEKYKGSEFSWVKDLIKPYINGIWVVGTKIGSSNRVAKMVQIEWKDEYKNNEKIIENGLDKPDTVVNLRNIIRFRLAKKDPETKKYFLAI